MCGGYIMNIYYCPVLEHSDAQQVIKVGPICAPPSILAQLLKNPPAMQETPVWFLGREDPLEKG